MRNDVINMSRARSLSRARDMLITSFLIPSLSLKFTIILYLSHTSDTWRFRHCCRTHVIHEPCIWPSSPWVLQSSVVRASDWSTHGRSIFFFLSRTRTFSLSLASDMLITSFLMSIQFCYSLPGVAVGVKSSLKLPLNWLCQWYQEGKNAVLLGTKNDRKDPYATVTECNNTTFKNIRYASRKITHREPVGPRHRGPIKLSETLQDYNAPVMTFQLMLHLTCFQ